MFRCFFMRINVPIAASVQRLAKVKKIVPCVEGAPFFVQTMQEKFAVRSTQKKNCLGNVDFSEFEKILPYVDTFLYDIKCVTSSLHKEFTGVTNEKIIENLKRLKQRGADLIIRVPVIGGFNDTDEEMGKIAALVREINPRKCELLPYHNLGEHKYEVTGVPYMIFETPDEKRIAYLKELLRV